jgi:hypothetical protein
MNGGRQSVGRPRNRGSLPTARRERQRPVRAPNEQSERGEARQKPTCAYGFRMSRSAGPQIATNQLREARPYAEEECDRTSRRQGTRKTRPCHRVSQTGPMVRFPSGRRAPRRRDDRLPSRRNPCAASQLEPSVAWTGSLKRTRLRDKHSQNRRRGDASSELGPRRIQRPRVVVSALSAVLARRHA